MQGRFFQWTVSTLSTKKKDGNDDPIFGCAPAGELWNARLMAVFVWLLSGKAPGARVVGIVQGTAFRSASIVIHHSQ